MENLKEIYSFKLKMLRISSKESQRIAAQKKELNATANSLPASSRSGRSERRARRSTHCALSLELFKFNKEQNEIDEFDEIIKYNPIGRAADGEPRVM